MAGWLAIRWFRAVSALLPLVAPDLVRALSPLGALTAMSPTRRLNHPTHSRETKYRTSCCSIVRYDKHSESALDKNSRSDTSYTKQNSTNRSKQAEPSTRRRCVEVLRTSEVFQQIDCARPSLHVALQSKCALEVTLVGWNDAPALPIVAVYTSLRRKLARRKRSILGWFTDGSWFHEKLCAQLVIA